jgi:RNA polymerase sigma-70 factor (ECF subfamily)
MLEEKLIQKAIEGDKAAFEKLIFNYEGKIYAIAFKVFKNEADAYDVAQEICIKVYKKIESFRYESSFSTWLYRLATNTAIDEYRKAKRKHTKESSIDVPIDVGEEQVTMQLTDQRDTPEEAFLRKEKIKYVWDALAKLTDEQKNIIILKDIEGKSYQEISDILNIHLGTVKSRLARSRIALKKVLQDLWEQNLL